jgi:hypothetical protein
MGGDDVGEGSAAATVPDPPEASPLEPADLGVSSLAVAAATPPPAAPAPDVHPLVDEALTLLRQAVEESTAAVRDADATVAEREDAYISATWAHGNLMRGWEGYCRRVDRAPTPGNGSGTATGAPKQRKLRPSDRMFSMTSATSAVRADAGHVDFGVKRGGVPKKKKKR